MSYGDKGNFKDVTLHLIIIVYSVIDIVRLSSAATFDQESVAIHECSRYDDNICNYIRV